MSKLNKKQVRAEFRSAVFLRDRFCCKKCGLPSSPEKAEEELDAHHIINRNLMPGGGYVRENGITLCKAKCHLKAEQGDFGYEEDELFRLIGSSKEMALKRASRMAAKHGLE